MIRQITILLAAMVISLAASAQKNLDEALGTARDSGKNILIVFSGSDWCIPCIKMEKQVFENEEFKKYAGDHLVIVHADFPRLKKNQLAKDQQAINEQLADKYNKKGSFPLTVLTDATGKVLKEWPGYSDQLTASAFVSQVETAVHAQQ